MSLPWDERSPRGGIWAAVPFKGPVGSKRRLSGILDADERTRLSQAMFEIVVGALLQVDAIDAILIVTPSRQFGASSNRGHIYVIQQDAPPEDGSGPSDGLNQAVRIAQQLAARGRADKLLVVPADLPLLASSDLTAMLDAGTDAAVAIAPDRERRGTNALLLSPPTAIAPAFGDGSFLHHHRLGRSASLSVTSVERAGLMVDLDTPADVEFLYRIGGDFRVLNLLREFGAAERLARG